MMSVSDMLKIEFGYNQMNTLDTNPPLSLLTQISLRSGIELDRLRCMNFEGFVPWLLDNMDDKIPDAIKTYIQQLSVLLPTDIRRLRPINRWRAWLPIDPIEQACPHCLADPQNKHFLLVWQLPLMLSCPIHSCRLEAYYGTLKHTFWEQIDGAPREMNDAIVAMDKRTWQALTTGYVELPFRRIHAGVWFRLLRTLLDELNTPLSYCGKYAKNIIHIWTCSGYTSRAGQLLWKPYEVLDLPVQLKMLETAAIAIREIELQVIPSPGDQGYLFLPPPIITRFQNNEPINHWHEAVKAINKALSDAQHNPDTARALFSLASLGQREPEQLERLRLDFIQNGIPSEFLSHFNPI
jgi:hypothetical protein